MKRRSGFIKKRLSLKRNTMRKEEGGEGMKLKDRLPVPTHHDPYSQVRFIFASVAESKFTESTKAGYQQALSFYVKFLKKTRNYDNRLEEDPRFYLSRYWDEFSLLKVEQYVSESNVKGEEGYLTSSTLVAYVSSIRKVLRFAHHHQLCATNEFFDIRLTKPERETEIRESYSKREYDQISDMLRQELQYVFRLLSGKGYEKTGVGRDPRIVCKKGRPRGEKAPEGVGWKELDNVRWYFENEMKCVAYPGTPQNRKKYGTFFQHAHMKHQHIGGISGIYKKWGVASLITSEILMPLAVKLISETGLNPESLWDLDVDCYSSSHPLSGVPYIKYFKRRSGGEKEMHFANKGKDAETKEFRELQAKVIYKTISQIKQITHPLREKAPEEIRNKLFLYESHSGRNYGRIGVLKGRATHVWCENMVEKYNLKSDKGDKLAFNLARFRPTRITRLVELGVDFFEIQHEAGHKNITTTLRYLSKNRLNITAKEETNKAMNKIMENVVWATKEQPAYAKEGNSAKEAVIYKGIMCDCKNPFDPPREVKRLKDYQEGQACTRFNMCLLCQNVILFRKHLPLLASYKKQIETAMSNPIGEIPNSFLYQQSLDVINSILDPERSEFEEKDILLALEQAETIDINIDPTIYKPTEY
jgi:site-specific recombinase XerD